MASIILRKRLGSLEPCDDASREALASIGFGELVRCEISRPRNLQWHRRYWAAIQLLFENQTRYATAAHLHAAVKHALGLSDLVVAANGDEIYVPRSESFGKMSQDEFQEFWDRFCDLIATKLLPGLKRADFESELKDIIGLGY